MAQYFFRQLEFFELNTIRQTFNTSESCTRYRYIYIYIKERIIVSILLGQENLL